VRAAVAGHGIARVKGLFDRAELSDVLRSIAANFDASCDRKHDPRDSDAVQRNFQKLQVGANSGIGTTRTLGRFMRTLFNPIFADDIYGMREHFVRLARFRNRLCELPEAHAVYGSEDGFFTCARLHQYPRGGGFMVPHRDVFARIAVEEKGTPYYQCFVLLSEKGEHYHEGGAYINTPQGRLEYEADCKVGDVIVYDGKTVHGVADIDPLEALDLAHFGGRVAAFASLFCCLDASRAGYAELSRRATETYAPEPGRDE
jgi:hypothetical protein